LEKAMTKVFALAVLTAALAVAPAYADTTIGSDVNDSPTTMGTCFGNPTFSCVVVPTSLTSGAQLTSPCDGTVTRFRINGVPTANTYRLRVIHLSGTTATAVSSSSAVSLAVNGINTFPVSLPIHTGDQFGLDFNHGTTDHSVRYRQTAPLLLYENGIPDSGTAIATGSNNSLEYLYNADVACGVPAPTTTKCKKKKHRDASVAKKKKGCKKKKKK
jgi:hypothetical protein